MKSPDAPMVIVKGFPLTGPVLGLTAAVFEPLDECVPDDPDEEAWWFDEPEQAASESASVVAAKAAEVRPRVIMTTD